MTRLRTFNPVQEAVQDQDGIRKATYKGLDHGWVIRRMCVKCQKEKDRRDGQMKLAIKKQIGSNYFICNECCPPKG